MSLSLLETPGASLPASPPPHRAGAVGGRRVTPPATAIEGTAMAGLQATLSALEPSRLGLYRLWRGSHPEIPQGLHWQAGGSPDASREGRGLFLGRFPGSPGAGRVATTGGL